MTRDKNRPAAYVREPRRQDMFDPALKHYASAFVHGPAKDRELTRALELARLPLLRLALRAIATSVRDLVVLRGSIALATWFPERARRPHDIDLVVRDPTCKPDDPRGRDLIAQLRDAVSHALAAAGVTPYGHPIALDAIWTYDRAEGRRLSFPWQFPWPPGDPVRDVVQIDLVFDEPLLEAPTLESIELGPSETGYRDAPERVWFASRAESLIWKLMWLESDAYPQGKDLYDAVLLAEHTPLSLDLARAVYAANNVQYRGIDRLTSESDIRAALEWETFALAYPELAPAEPDAYFARLATLITKSFS